MQSFRSSRSGSYAALDEITDPPNFIKHPEPHQVTSEGDPISLTARVAPAGDPNLTVQWYKDGNLLNAGANTLNTFCVGRRDISSLHIPTLTSDNEIPTVIDHTF